MYDPMPKKAPAQSNAKKINPAKPAGVQDAHALNKMPEVSTENVHFNSFGKPAGQNSGSF